ncbi:hypothetical protein BJ165DRAFT_1352076, partial [Panaeolus papilionaceus]
APGEAESELARLNQRGLIDGIMETDSDTFVFGGCTVYKPYAFLSSLHVFFNST